MKSIIAILLVVVLYACQSQKAQQSNEAIVETIQDELCIAFDQRQCQTDAFATFLPQDKNSDEMFMGMQSYLTESNIQVLHMRIDLNFHETTCAACDVCPEQHRFFLSLRPSEFEKLKDLNLLNLSPVDCNEYF